MHHQTTAIIARASNDGENKALSRGRNIFGDNSDMPLKNINLNTTWSSISEWNHDRLETKISVRIFEMFDTEFVLEIEFVLRYRICMKRNWLADNNCVRN